MLAFIYVRHTFWQKKYRGVRMYVSMQGADLPVFTHSHTTIEALPTLPPHDSFWEIRERFLKIMINSLSVSLQLKAPFHKSWYHVNSSFYCNFGKIRGSDWILSTVTMFVEWWKSNFSWYEIVNHISILILKYQVINCERCRLIWHNQRQGDALICIHRTK